MNLPKMTLSAGGADDSARRPVPRLLVCGAAGDGKSTWSAAFWSIAALAARRAFRRFSTARRSFPHRRRAWPASSICREHGDERCEQRSRDPGGRRPQGRRRTEPARSGDRLHARRPPYRAGGQQDGSGRFTARPCSTPSVARFHRSFQRQWASTHSPRSRCRRARASMWPRLVHPHALASWAVACSTTLETVEHPPPTRQGRRAPALHASGRSAS